MDFCGFNVSISRPGASRWALTERPAAALSRDSTALSIGPSSMRWTGDGLAIDIDEVSAPWGRKIRGRVLFRPEIQAEREVPIDGRGLHLWWPVAPLGRVEVELEEPNVRFAGCGYFDANAGAEPLEDAFATWSWARVSSGADVAITYDVTTRRGGDIEHGILIDRAGVRPLLADARIGLGATRYRLDRSMRSPSPGETRLVRSLEDGPFYARSLVEGRSAKGQRTLGVHEVVSLDRFASSWVRFLIPFRMRREAA